MPDKKNRTMLMDSMLLARCMWLMPDEKRLQAEMIP